MAGMEEALTQHLLADAGLTALIGTNVHWLRLPTVIHARPYLNLQVISQITDYHMTGETGLRRTRVQADVWDETMLGAKNASRAFHAAVSNYSGTVAGIVFQAIFVENARDSLEATPGQERRLFRVSTDIEVNWNEE